MDKRTKITLEVLMQRQEQMRESKKKKKTKDLYVTSLDGTITIQQPTSEQAHDAQEMEAGEGDKYLVYEIVTDPPLKSQKLQDVFVDKENGEQPFDIVDKIFDPGEVPQIALAGMKLAGYIDSVKEVDEVKN